MWMVVSRHSTEDSESVVLLLTFSHLFLIDVSMICIHLILLLQFSSVTPTFRMSPSLHPWTSSRVLLSFPPCLAALTQGPLQQTAAERLFLLKGVFLSHCYQEYYTYITVLYILPMVSMYNINGFGPRTEPCGTPSSVWCKEDPLYMSKPSVTAPNLSCPSHRLDSPTLHLQLSLLPHRATED